MQTILCVDEQRGRLLALSAMLKAGGYLCIATPYLEQAELSIAMYQVDLVIVFEHVRAKIRTDLQKIRNVPVLVLEEPADAAFWKTEPDMQVYEQHNADTLLRTVGQLLAQPAGHGGRPA